MNVIIFDYLLIEGFSDAAVEFARETGLPADVDHAMIQERMDIRDAVVAGRVEEAVRRVNELDPEVSDVFHVRRRGERGWGTPRIPTSCTTLSRFSEAGHAETPDFTDLI